MDEFYAHLAADELLEALEDAPMTPDLMNAMATLSGAIGQYQILD